MDRDYLAVALATGQLQGRAVEFLWAQERKVPTRELRGTHAVVIAFNADKRVKYRLCRSEPGDRLVLMKKTGGTAVL